MSRALDLAKVEQELKKVCQFCGNPLIPVSVPGIGDFLSCRWEKVSYKIVARPELRQVGEYYDPGEENVLENATDEGYPQKEAADGN